MKTENEMYWVLETSKTTYVKCLDGYHNGGIDTAWGDVKTAEHFNSGEEANDYAENNNINARIVCVVESVNVSDNEEPPTTIEERIRRIFYWYYHDDDDTMEATDALDEIEKIIKEY